MLKGKSLLEDLNLVKKLENKAAELIKGGGDLKWVTIMDPKTLPLNSVKGGFSFPRKIEFPICKVWFSRSLALPGYFFEGACHVAFNNEESKIVPGGSDRVEILTHT